MKASINHSVLSTTAAFATIALSASFASADIIYSNIPAVLPGNVPSIGYEATSTSELGNGVLFAGTDRNLTSVTIGLSDFADRSAYPLLTDPTGWDHPVTVNVYSVGVTPGSIGSLIATRTQTVHVPWHDIASTFSGTLFTAAFDFTGTTVPDSAIFTVAYNTQHDGETPLGVAGPYNSLNLGTVAAPAPIGGDLDIDDAYLSTTWANFYTDGGTGGTGFLRQDTGWTGYTPMLEVVAVPEPTSIALLGLGAAALLRRRRRTV